MFVLFLFFFLTEIKGPNADHDCRRSPFYMNLVVYLHEKLKEVLIVTNAINTIKLRVFSNRVIYFYCNLNLLKVGVTLITSVGSMFDYKMVTV